MDGSDTDVLDQHRIEADRKKAESERSQLKKARKQWDFQIARSVSSLNVWRAVALILAVSLFISVYSISRYMAQPKLLPYVVEVQGDQISFKGMMRTTPLTINDAVVINYLKRFVINLRSISSDIVILKTNLSDVFWITSVAAQNQVKGQIFKDKPFEQSTKGIHRDVQFTLFQHETEKTWRVEWIEEIRQEGTLEDTANMAGTFTYTQQNPPTEAAAEANPFGLYFTEFFVSQRRQ
jgi:type IV secretion system protein TrbF